MTTTIGPSSPDGHEWTGDIPDSEHVRFFLSADWANSRLGPLELWSNALRIYTYQILADSRPAVMYWGPGKVAIYNEAFVPLAGKRHPELMGTRFEDAYPEIWEDIKPVFDGAISSKQAVDVVEIPLMVERNNFLEETYFTGNFNPLRGDSGRVEGFYNALGEVTRQKLADRRTDMLNMIPVLPEEQSSRTIGSHIMTCLETNPLDIPFALLYQLGQDSEFTPTSSPALSFDHATKTADAIRPGLLNLRGSIGAPRDHQLFVAQGYLDSDAGIFPLLRTIAVEPITVPPGEAFDGLECNGFGEPLKYVSAMPLFNAGRLYGYLVVGTNPRRPIDADHNHFMQSLGAQISSTLAIVLNTERLTLQQHDLETKLAASERHIRYMAEHLDSGLEHLTLDGNLIWANEHYYKLLGIDSTRELGNVVSPFHENVYDGDQILFQQALKRAVAGAKTYKLEIRINKLYNPPSGPAVPATVLVSAFPYFEDGQIKSIMSCMTEVSRLKWAESWQARAANEAHQAKLQQSEFTDAISHEVRNPLSAILQLADCIATASDGPQTQRKRSIDDYMEVVREHVEAAKAILVCANHQKQIVDDVLTLSKMDYKLITLSPTAIQPAGLVDGALKIVNAELVAADISLEVRPEESIHGLKVDWILCDPLRVTQILINLFLNAVKFTKREHHRHISFSYGAALSDPRSAFSQDIIWAPTKRVHEDATRGEEWGTGEHVYLTFNVNDTGPGMSEEEKNRLFQRFQQASPKTSIKYGGSGLGLFISHSLAERQGGSIGLCSKVNQGSTFAFFIKARRTKAPKSPISMLALHPKLLKPGVIESKLVEPTVAEIKCVEQDGIKIIEEAPTLETYPTQMPKSSQDALYHVILVEDNLLNQRILMKQLVKAGCVVHVANHGLDALEVLKSTELWKENAASGNRLDVILMDVEMPVMDGLTACRVIRDLEKTGELTKKVEIIAITANARKEQIDRTLAAGIDEVVAKPFKVVDLLEVIKRRLGR